MRSGGFGRNGGPLEITSRRSDADILHHSLVLVVEDMAVKYKITDVSLVPGAHFYQVAFVFAFV